MIVRVNHTLAADEHRSLNAFATAWYDARAIARYAPRPLLRRIVRRRYTRTATSVLNEYDNTRREYHKQFASAPPPLTEYLVTDADLRSTDRSIFQLNNRLVYGRPSLAEERVRERLVRAIGRYRPQSVIEFGCGTARNLLAIKRAYPHVHCVGLELSPASATLAAAASQHYGLPIEVHVADVARPVADVSAATVCFSVHALEQIPNARSAFDQMYALATSAIVLFEPITERFAWTPRGIAARIRAKHLDRLRGLYPYVVAKGYTVTVCQLLPDATEPLNPTVELHIAKT